MPLEEFTISGIIKFGKANGLAGATVASFDLRTAQALLNRPGQFDTVNLLAKSGTSASSLKSEVSKQLPKGFEAITGSELAKESAKQVNKALGQMDDNTQRNSALVEQSTATAKMLANQAAAMNAQVGMFRIAAGAAETVEQSAAA